MLREQPCHHPSRLSLQLFLKKLGRMVTLLLPRPPLRHLSPPRLRFPMQISCRCDPHACLV